MDSVQDSVFTDFLQNPKKGGSAGLWLSKEKTGNQHNTREFVVITLLKVGTVIINNNVLIPYVYALYLSYFYDRKESLWMTQKI